MLVSNLSTLGVFLKGILQSTRKSSFIQKEIPSVITKPAQWYKPKHRYNLDIHFKRIFLIKSFPVEFIWRKLFFLLLLFQFLPCNILEICCFQPLWIHRTAHISLELQVQAFLKLHLGRLAMVHCMVLFSYSLSLETQPKVAVVSFPWKTVPRSKRRWLWLYILDISLAKTQPKVFTRHV